MLPIPVPSKEAAKELETGGKWFFGIIQRLLRLSETQTKQGGLIEAQASQIKAQADEISELRQTIRHLQAREDTILARAETTATKAAAITPSDLSRRLGVLEGRADRKR